MRHVSKDMWVVIAGFLDRVWCAIFSRTPLLRVSTLEVFLILHISDKHWITSFGGALRFGGVAFPVHRTSQLTLNLKPTKTRLERIRNYLKPPRSSKRLWTARFSSAIDDMAGNNACMEVLFEATFRQRASRPS